MRKPRVKGKMRQPVKLDILTGYEGSNPQQIERIRRTGPSTLVVSPVSEDGDSNYKFAFDITILNPTRKPASIDLTIDWQEPPEIGSLYMKGRSSIFLGKGFKWREISLTSEHDKSHVHLSLAPGETRVCIQPPFGAAEMELFFKTAGRLPGSQRIRFGRTAEGRPLEAVRIPCRGRAKGTLLALGRFHPYETAGSWQVMSILDLLSSRRGPALRRDWNFLLVPMANPDGVAHGFCKRTTTGVDLSAEGNNSPDPTANAIRGLIAGVAAASRRVALLDAHNWMMPPNGISCYSGDLGRRMQQALTGPLFPTGWKLTHVADITPAPTTPDLRRHAAGVLGMEVIVTSLPWYGRTIRDMRRAGAALAAAFLDSLHTGRDRR